MKEHSELSAIYESLGKYCIETYEDLRWILDAPVRIGYLRSDKEKKGKGKLVMGECVKVQDLYKGLIPYDFLIVIYEAKRQSLNDQQMEILMRHELLHIGVDDNAGEIKYSIVPHDTEDFKSIVREHGIDWAHPIDLLSDLEA